MKHLKKFNESIIYGQKDRFSNINILNDVNDILLELEDIGIECEIWTNGYENSIFKSVPEQNILKRIVIDINHMNGKNIDIVKDVVERLKDYFEKNGRIITYEDKNGTELNIDILK